MPFLVGMNHGPELFRPCGTGDTECEANDLFNRVYDSNATRAVSDVVKNLRNWNFSSVGYDWTDGLPGANELFMSEMPFFSFTQLLNTDAGEGPSQWQPPSKFILPDPWDDAVMHRMRDRVTAKCEQARPYRHNLAGYIWTDLPAYDINSTQKKFGRDWVTELRCLPVTAAGRQQYNRHVANRTCAGEFSPNACVPSLACERYGLSVDMCPSWEALDFCHVESKNVPAMLQDDYAFLPSIVDQIYSVANESVVACDPDALVLGDTFMLWVDGRMEGVFEATAPYTHVMSLQAGGSLIDVDELRGFSERAGSKPVMLSDMGFAFPHVGYDDIMWKTYASQESAAAAWRSDLVRAAQSGFIIGGTKCQYIDRVVGGGKLKPGILDFDGSPHQPFVDLMHAANSEAIEIAHRVRVGEFLV